MKKNNKFNNNKFNNIKKIYNDSEQTTIDNETIIIDNETIIIDNETIIIDNETKKIISDSKNKKIIMNNDNTKLINNEEIKKINILATYNIEYDYDEKINIKNIFNELLLIKELFNIKNIIEIIKFFKFNKQKKFNDIFLDIFNIIKEEYINNYDFIMIIFSLLKIYKYRYEILKIYELQSFLKSLKKYLLSLSLKSELIKIILLLDKINITEFELIQLFTMLFKELSKYLSYSDIYKKLLDSIIINSDNEKLINNNKKKILKKYNEIDNNLNDLYEINNFNKYKIDNDISIYFLNILKNIKKI